MGSIYFSDEILRVIPPKKSRANFALMVDTFEHLTSPAQSKATIAIDELYRKKTKNHLIFIISDSLEALDEKKLRALASRNDLVWFHIFDSYENTLRLDAPIHLTDKKSHLLAVPDEKKRSEYERFRTEKIKHFESIVRSAGGDYLCFDETDNTFKKLFGFFKKRQARI